MGIEPISCKKYESLLILVSMGAVARPFSLKRFKNGKK